MGIVEQGLSKPVVAAAAGVVVSASVASRVVVSHLPSAVSAEVPVLLNTLVERGCGVIVVTGVARSRVAGVARADPGRRFILVTGGTAVEPVTVLPDAVTVSAADASGRISREVLALAGVS